MPRQWTGQTTINTCTRTNQRQLSQLNSRLWPSRQPTGPTTHRVPLGVLALRVPLGVLAAVVNGGEQLPEQKHGHAHHHDSGDQGQHDPCQRSAGQQVSKSAGQLPNYQYNAFWGDQRSERDSGPCTCEIATGYLELTCARHPANRSLTVYQIWAQSV